MNFISVEPPKIVRRIFNDFIWENNEDKIILTFDDGPFPEVTETILKILGANSIRGIFFLNGKNINENFDLVEKIVSNNHFIANHSFSHSKKMLSFTEDELMHELLETENLISNRRNFLKLFRPPYGRMNFKMMNLLKRMNYKVVMWSLLTEDYLSDFERTRKNIEKHLKKNSIVVFHNNLKSKPIIENSLEYLINLVEKRGFKIGNNFNF